MKIDIRIKIKMNNPFKDEYRDRDKEEQPLIGINIRIKIKMNNLLKR